MSAAMPSEAGSSRRRVLRPGLVSLTRGVRGAWL